MSDNTEMLELAPKELVLGDWHRAKAARMVSFAGYAMPIQYDGIMAEHLWTRENAGLFDVSHMGQLILSGENVAEALEAIVPGDISALKEGRMRYSLLLAADGGEASRYRLFAGASARRRRNQPFGRPRFARFAGTESRRGDFAQYPGR
jgi:Aminomethyltransferase folate-binding domain